MRISYTPIGIIHTAFTETEGMPIQAALATGNVGRVEVLPEFADGLADIDGFSHIILLYHFHRSTPCPLTVTPFLDKTPRGVFSTRAPSRPNPIGFSVVKLVEVKKNILRVENVDMLDATPLLDIKPYVPRFDHFDADRTGWLERIKEISDQVKSDKRFE